MLALLRNPGVRLYVVGQTLSGLGSSSLWLAAAIWINSLTGSAGAAGMVMFFFGASALVGPVWGLLVDRVRRLPLLIASSAVGVVLLLPLLFVTGKAALWTVFAVMFAYGILNRITTSAQNALLPTVVPDDLLADANGILRSLQEAMRIVAPLLGAGLFAWQGIAAVVYLDMATFVVGGAIFWIISRRITESAPKRPDPAVRLRAEITAGIRHLAADPVLRAVVGGATVAALVFGFGESGMFAVATDGLHKPSAFVGVLGMAQGAGSVVIGFVVGKIARLVGDVRLVAIGLAGFGASMVLLTVSSLPVVLGGVVLAGLSLPLVGVGAVTCLQRHTPDELRGRAYSSFDMAFTTAMTGSVVVGAALVGPIGYRAMYVIAAAVLVVGAALVMLGRPAEAAGAGDETADRSRKATR